MAMNGASGSRALWEPSPRERLTAARSLTPAELAGLAESFLKGCPTSKWPYGCSTSINPWVLFLGPSPGASPAAGDANYVARVGHPPTAGTPPSSMVYSDPRGYFERLRVLTLALVRVEGGSSFSQSEALSISGMMNLDSGASGEARNVNLNAKFARWALEVSFRCLRPRYLVGVGLGAFVRQPGHRWLLEAIGAYVSGRFHPDQPHKSAPFKGYHDKQYTFRAWQASDGGPGAQHLILFPQHPSRAPMTSPTVWAAAVREFVSFAGAL